MTSLRALSLGVAASTFLVLATGTPAQAQAGLGANLDDPTGRAPIRTQRSPFVGDSVPAPPSYGGGDEAIDDSGIARFHLIDRLRALDATWATLGMKGTSYTNSVFSLVAGASLIVIGGVLLEVDSSAGTTDYEIIAPMLLVMGGVSIARTIIVDFVLRPNPQPIAIEYARMPSGTRAQQLARLRYGEEQLEAIAERSMILRFVDSGINIASVAALIGMYLEIRGDRDFEAIEAIFFIGPAISTVIAVINLFSPSSAEQRWDAYREMREHRGGDIASVHVEPVLSADPRGGGYLGLRGSF